MYSPISKRLIWSLFLKRRNSRRSRKWSSLDISKMRNSGVSN